MKTMNKALLIGRLASDPEVHKTTTGKIVVNFPLVTNFETTNEKGEKEEKADFHRIIAWEKLAEICEKYLKKGSAVFIGGRISNRNYEDKKGEKKYITEIVANEINILTWKKNEEIKGEKSAE